MLSGQIHLIKCTCILPQFRGKDSPPQHQFATFSIVEDENVKVKYAQCNNCLAIHRVTDICKSEIIVGKDSVASLINIEDIKASLPKSLVNILERSEVDIACWEKAQFIFENKQWGNFVLLTSEEDSGKKQGKYVILMSETFFKVETYSREDTVVYTGN